MEYRLLVTFKNKTRVQKDVCSMQEVVDAIMHFEVYPDLYTEVVKVIIKKTCVVQN